MTKPSLRFGAALFAIGFLLAGPQAVGIASADAPREDSASAQAGSGPRRGDGSPVTSAAAPTTTPSPSRIRRGQPRTDHSSAPTAAAVESGRRSPAPTATLVSPKTAEDASSRAAQVRGPGSALSTPAVQSLETNSVRALLDPPAPTASVSAPIKPGFTAVEAIRHTETATSLISTIPGSVEAVAAAPIASAATTNYISGAATPVTSPTDALTLWAAAINNAIAARLAERIRQTGTVATTSTSLDLGLGPAGDPLSASPELTYTTSIPVNESFTVTGQTFTIAASTVDPISWSPDGWLGLAVDRVDIKQVAVSPITVRVPDVTVQLGSPDTAIDLSVTAAVPDLKSAAQGAQSGIGFTIPKTALSVDGGITVNVPLTVTAAGPVQIDGFTLTGLTANIAPTLSWLYSDTTVSVGSCSSPSRCNDTLTIPAITIRNDGPLLQGVIGGPDTKIQVDVEGLLGPIDVAPGLSTTISGPNGGAIPFAVNGTLPVNIPITAELGDFILDGFTLPTASSWTPNSLPSAFAIWMPDGGPFRGWSDDVGTNLILPGTPIEIPSVLLTLPTVSALIGGPGTAVPISVEGGIGPIRATPGLTWDLQPTLTISGVNGGEIPINATAEIPIDIPLEISATPIQISGLGGAAPATVPVAASAPGSKFAGLEPIISALQSSPLRTLAPLTSAVPHSTPPRIFQAIHAGVTGVLDGVGIRLSTLPDNRVNAALADVVWLARKTLSPVGVDVLRWGSTACVETKDCSDQDLTGANLSGRDLTGVNFTGTVLTRANLTTANLRAAILHSAILTNADVGNADLTDATLAGATLTGLRGLSSATLVGADLSGQNFASSYLAGKDFSRANLTNANMRSANLINANFADATLSGADLTAAGLGNANLTGARLIGTTLTYTDLSRARLSGANLTNAILTKAFLDNANLSGATMTGVQGLSTAELTGANLAGTASDLSSSDLSGKDLTGTDLSGANLRNADLTNAKIAKASLSGTTLTGATLKGVQGWDTARLTGADFSGLDFWANNITALRGKDLTGANFTGANLRSVDLTGSNLSNANLSGAKLYATQLTDATLGGVRGLSTASMKYADFHRADLSGVDLSGADLSHTFLINAKLSDANLTDAKLKDTYLSGASLVFANLTHADLTNADLSGAEIRKAVLTGVHWQNTTCPDGSKTDTGCSALPTAPIRIPTIQIGQGAISSGDSIGSLICTIVCSVPEVGASVTVGGIEIDPVTVGFLDSDNTALTATIGGPGKGIGIDVTAGLGPVTVPLSGAPGGSIDVPFHDAVTIRRDVPVNGTLFALRTDPIVTSLPYEVASWYRQGLCGFGSCTWSGWTDHLLLFDVGGVWASGDLGGTYPAVTLSPTTTFGTHDKSA